MTRLPCYLEKAYRESNDPLPDVISNYEETIIQRRRIEYGSYANYFLNLDSTIFINHRRAIARTILLLSQFPLYTGMFPGLNTRTLAVGDWEKILSIVAKMLEQNDANESEKCQAMKVTLYLLKHFFSHGRSAFNKLYETLLESQSISNSIAPNPESTKYKKLYYNYKKDVSDLEKCERFEEALNKYRWNTRIQPEQLKAASKSVGECLKNVCLYKETNILEVYETDGLNEDILNTIGEYYQ